MIVEEDKRISELAREHGIGENLLRGPVEKSKIFNILKDLLLIPFRFPLRAC